MKKILLSLIIIFSTFVLFGCNNKEKIYTVKPASYRLLEDGTYGAEFDVDVPFYPRGICLKIPKRIDGKKVTQLVKIEGFCEGIIKIKISKNITYIDESELYKLENLREIEVSKLNKKYSSLDGILYSKLKTELIYSPRSIGGEIRFPLALTKIRPKAFYESHTLTSIQIPETVVEIGEYAFYRCDRLQKLSFHDNCKITEINNSTFAYCDGIWFLTLPKSIKIIDSYAFYNCSALKIVNFNGESQLEEIRRGAFRHCVSLEEIYLSNTLNLIADEAFYNCKNLNAIHYNGTIEHWEKIVIEEDNENLNSANIYFNQ